jgi:hypothetical protein
MPIILLPDSTDAYFTIAEGRASDATFAGLTDNEIAEARAEVEAEIENSLCPGYAFVPRTATAILDGPGRGLLLLPHLYVRSVTSVRVYTDAATFTDYTADELADVVVSETGAISRSTLGYWPAGFQNVHVTYTHGFDAPPANVKRAALILMRYRTAGARWRIPSTPTAVDAEGNPTAEGLTPAQTSGTAFEDSPSGIPEVDDLLRPWLGGVPVLA